jgi:F-type H+-transporting ATPase subunit gamma
MAKIHKIRGRIRSVGKVGQITKAMEKVAASKMRRAQEATLRSRAYAFSAREALARLYVLTGPKEHELFATRPVKSRLVILFSSDRGLAGAYNSNLFKKLVERVHDPAVKTKLIVIGEKGAQFVSKLGSAVDVIGVYTNWPTTPTSTDTRPIVETALTQFREGSVDTVELLYTDFTSPARQEVRVRSLLPINPEEIFGKEARVGKAITEAEFEPSPATVLTFIVPRLLEVQIYQAALEAIASEQSMRMVAMKNASDNAEELVDDLTLTYNSARQSAITQELAEISAGAEAIS